jgi:hypothetical protein
MMNSIIALHYAKLSASGLAAGASNQQCGLFQQHKLLNKYYHLKYCAFEITTGAVHNDQHRERLTCVR